MTKTLPLTSDANFLSVFEPKVRGEFHQRFPLTYPSGIRCGEDDGIGDRYDERVEWCVRTVLRSDDALRLFLAKTDYICDLLWNDGDAIAVLGGPLPTAGLGPAPSTVEQEDEA
jgi:hypothetical protein